MNAAATYTEQVAVRLPATTRNEIERHLGDDVGLSAAMRNAALKAIGRADLIFDDQRDESGHKRKRTSSAKWVITPVKMTLQQKRALAKAAKTAGSSLSALLLESLRFELGLATPAPGKHKGWQFGKRRSSPPKRR